MYHINNFQKKTKTTVSATNNSNIINEPIAALPLSLFAKQMQTNQYQHQHHQYNTRYSINRKDSLLSTTQTTNINDGGHVGNKRKYDTSKYKYVSPDA